MIHVPQADQGPLVPRVQRQRLPVFLLRPLPFLPVRIDFRQLLTGPFALGVQDQRPPHALLRLFPLPLAPQELRQFQASPCVPRAHLNRHPEPPLLRLRKAVCTIPGRVLHPPKQRPPPFPGLFQAFLHLSPDRPLGGPKPLPLPRNPRQRESGPLGRGPRIKGRPQSLGPFPLRSSLDFSAPFGQRPHEPPFPLSRPRQDPPDLRYPYQFDDAQFPDAVLQRLARPRGLFQGHGPLLVVDPHHGHDDVRPVLFQIVIQLRQDDPGVRAPHALVDHLELFLVTGRVERKLQQPGVLAHGGGLPQAQHPQLPFPSADVPVTLSQEEQGSAQAQDPFRQGRRYENPGKNQPGSFPKSRGWGALLGRCMLVFSFLHGNDQRRAGQKTGGP